MLKEHDWIAAEKQYFGVEGTAYEFRQGDPSRDPKMCKRRLAELKSASEKLANRVNMKVMSMFEKAEKEYSDLLQKKQIVEGDRSKIESAIAELDEKKNEALRKAHRQVNRDFGSIFSTLLPGTNAKVGNVAALSSPSGVGWAALASHPHRASGLSLAGPRRGQIRSGGTGGQDCLW